MVESAISRSETTGFLSLSRSIVSCEPDEIIRARCAANKTRSKRLSTLSMQSSTVTRAIACRSVKWDRICWLWPVVIGLRGVSQDQFVIWSLLAPLLTRFSGPHGPECPKPDLAFGQENALLRHQSYTFIALSPPICGSVCPDRSDGGIWQYVEMRGSKAAAPKKATNNYARN